MEKNTLIDLLADDNANEQLIKNWVSSEYSFWSAINKTLGLGPHPYPPGVLTEYLNILSDQLDAFTLTGSLLDLYKLHSLINISQENKLPNHDSQVSHDIIKNVSDKETLTMLLFSLKVSSDLIDGFLKGTATTQYKELLDKKIAEFSETKEEFTTQTQTLLHTINTRQEDAALQFEGLVGLASKKLSDDTEKHTNEITNITKRIEQSIVSNAPVTFWTIKEHHHKNQAAKYQKAAISLGVVASTVLLFLILAAFKDQDTTILLGFKLPNHFYLAALILIGSAFVWALRISIQLMMTHVALESEALERSTAIKTYVALATHTINPEIEKEFHKSLLTFSKVKISDDSHHPELIRLVEQFLNKDKTQ